MDVNYMNILYDLRLYFSLSHYYFHVQTITLYKCWGNNGYCKVSGNLRVERRSSSKTFMLLLFKNYRDRIFLEASFMIFEDYQINMFSLDSKFNSGNNIYISCIITALSYHNLLYNRILRCT